MYKVSKHSYQTKNRHLLKLNIFPYFQPHYIKNIRKSSNYKINSTFSGKDCKIARGLGFENISDEVRT